ncbi:uncharacterized protein LOC114184679 [Vigna unguiculata]|uniref:uncharacterized protein LOC114184679 n=1 Tax=Vigna unguiculata TaxID=3917 RepID=UPI001015FBA6|nr:uncharacterized protein LOC114184679 [Vigna unguiculata]
MYKDLKATFWWKGMKTNVADYVASCLVCQKGKIEHQRPGGTLEPLDIPQWKWDIISMDFVTHMPRSEIHIEILAVAAESLRHSVENELGLSSFDRCYHSNIGMAPYEALYNRRCQTLLYWQQDGDRQKFYADKRRLLEFEAGDHITRRIGLVAYEIALPPHLANLHNVFHVSQLRKYIAYPTHVLKEDNVQVLWDEATQEMTWEMEDLMSKSYPHLFPEARQVTHTISVHFLGSCKEPPSGELGFLDEGLDGGD